MWSTWHPEMQCVTLRLPRAVWEALPSNTAEFDALTLDEEGALRSILADLWTAVRDVSCVEERNS